MTENWRIGSIARPLFAVCTSERQRRILMVEGQDPSFLRMTIIVCYSERQRRILMAEGEDPSFLRMTTVYMPTAG